MRAVSVMVTARQQNLCLINVDKVHERAGRKAQGKLEHPKHVILTYTNATKTWVQGKFHLIGEMVTLS